MNAELLVGRSSDDSVSCVEVKRELVELEREIGLTTPIIAELDARLTGQTSGSDKPQGSQTVPSTEPSSSAEPTVKAADVENSSETASVEKLPTAVDSGLQMESPTSSGAANYQVCSDV